MSMKPEDYFKGLLNKNGTTVPEDHKAHFNKKLAEVKAKYQASAVADPGEVERRIKAENAHPTPIQTEQKVNMFKEKYKHMLPKQA